MQESRAAPLASGLDAVIAEAGYAQILIRLAPEAAADPTTEGDLSGHFIVPDPEQAQAQAQALALSLGTSRGRKRLVMPPPAPRMRVFPHLGLALGFADAQGTLALRHDRRVQTVAQAPMLRMVRPVHSGQPSARLASETSWGLLRMRVPRLWGAGITGKGILVGHLDTGVDGSHPALAGAIKHFAMFDYSGNELPGVPPYDSDPGGHGTHTAGTIAARPIGHAAFGVAPGAELASAIVIEGGTLGRVLAGMDWIIDRGARILNLSLGVQGFTPAFEPIIDALRSAGVLPIVAVGNEGPNTSRSPGNYANVVSVGAMDSKDQVPFFSGSEKFQRSADPLVPDVVAPGVDIRSCLPKVAGQPEPRYGRYGESDGSSMACPHVAGLAALLLEAKPDATVAALQEAILRSCARPSKMLEARANRGVPDAVRAYEILTGKAVPAAALQAAVPRARTVARVSRTPVRLPRLAAGEQGLAASLAKPKRTERAKPTTKASKTAKPASKAKRRSSPAAKTRAVKKTSVRSTGSPRGKGKGKRS